ncbi:MAG: 4-(cytidine 5'-diphospho)-2-C-methyl-D-erythritol kinase [Candidatus Omnitrophota bacterium]
MSLKSIPAGARAVFCSYAKVNLYLEVLRRRRDGYHDIRTLFERIDLRDKISVRLRDDGIINVACDHPGVPQNEDNLVYRAADELFKFAGVRGRAGADIRIRKNIPPGAGLGGGSGNAAAVLLELNRLSGLKLPFSVLLEIASGIGSDTAFFLYECPFGLGTGRGEVITPLRGLNKLFFYHVLVFPSISAPTPLTYREWDKRRSLRKKDVLTKSLYNVKIINSSHSRYVFSGYKGELFNGLESVAVDLYPEVRRVKETFARLGIEANAMSGSGSCVFAVVSSRREASNLARLMSGINRRWRVFAAGTALSRKEQHKEVGRWRSLR